LRAGTIYSDTVAVIPRFTENLSAKCPYRCIPYRSLVPRTIENLLVAGRCFSSDVNSNDVLNLIPFCMQMGEAAGTAAALALEGGVLPRSVDYRNLQQRLRGQGAWLPQEISTAAICTDRASNA